MMAGYFLLAEDAPRSWPDALVTVAFLALIAWLAWVALR